MTTSDDITMIGKRIFKYDVAFAHRYLDIIKASGIADLVFDSGIGMTKLRFYAVKKPFEDAPRVRIANMINANMSDPTLKTAIACLEKASYYSTLADQNRLTSYTITGDNAEVELLIESARLYAHANLCKAWFRLAEYLIESGYSADDLMI